MTQRDLDLAVASATGEDLTEIQRRGFNLLDPSQVDYDQDPLDIPPRGIDWDDDHNLRPRPRVAFIHQIFKEHTA